MRQKPIPDQKFNVDESLEPQFRIMDPDPWMIVEVLDKYLCPPLKDIPRLSEFAA